MKRISILAFSLAVLFAAALASCQPEEPSIEFSGSTSFEIKPEGGSQSVGLTTNYEWSAKSSDSWISVSPSSGKEGSSSITIRVESNNTGSARRGTVTVTCMSLSRTIDISQKENPTVSYDGPSTIEIAPEGGSQTVSLSSNNSWDAKASDSWIKVEPTSGAKGSFTLKISAEANDTGKAREGSVTVTCLTASASFKVTQQPNLSQVLIIKHQNQTFTVPMISGGSLLAKVLWGDDSSEESYSTSLKHSYAKGGSYTVTIKMFGGTGFEMATIAGIDEIDISEF